MKKALILTTVLMLLTIGATATAEAKPTLPDLFDCLPEDDQCKCLDNGGGIRCVIEREPCNITGRDYC